jgi:hypothetical protein
LSSNLDQARTAAAAILPEKVEQLLENLEIDGIENPLSILARVDQSVMGQLLQVMRESGIGATHLFLDIGHAASLIAILNQQADYFQTGIRTKSFEQFCEIRDSFVRYPSVYHNSIIIEIHLLVKNFSAREWLAS